ncbi:MAG: Tripeptidyl-peptidase sed1 [Claussenomyces sp. TS43310]|nr:MAG: Tripeptidyl-peptidase sed1 [Claussenomyces sp. TS43310]
MRFSTLAAVGALVAGACALPSPVAYVAHERRDVLPKTWARRSKLTGAESIPVRIGLTQSNLHRGYDLLMDVSRHDSPRYGQHYSAEQVADIFAPSLSAVDTVKTWLEAEGIDGSRVSQSTNKQWLQFDAEASELMSLLQTEYYFYEHEATGAHNIACDEYHVPDHVKAHIDYITPGIKLFTTASKGSKETIEKRTFGVTSGKPSTVRPPLLKDLGMSLQDLLSKGSLSLCTIAITPDCIRALYNITKPTTAVAGNALGIFEALGDIYSQQDLSEFFDILANNIPSSTHPTLHGVDGGTAPTSVANAGAESDLDFQLAYPIVYPQNITLFQTDDPVYEANYTFEGFFNTFLDAIDGSYCSYSAYGETGDSNLDPPYPDPAPGGYKGALQCGVYKPTNVISISYGGQESDLPPSYQERQCNEFMKLGLQGVSVVVASGDSGVAGPSGDDSANGCLLNGTVFSPDFPATCPYITTLGATYLPSGADVTKDEEVAVTRFPSGGGFSNIYPIPDYQASAVAHYFKVSDPAYKYYEATNGSGIGAHGGIYNRIGRGYPDFAGIGDNVLIFNAGTPSLIGGTSAATPLFASVLNRINEERLAANKSTVGFVNPTLYANPHVLHDITVGNNSGCGTSGFFASEGWDPVTGLGTLNYPAMLDLFMGLS